jgi:hypothetical protein
LVRPGRLERQPRNLGLGRTKCSSGRMGVSPSVHELVDVLTRSGYFDPSLESYSQHSHTEFDGLRAQENGFMNRFVMLVVPILCVVSIPYAAHPEATKSDGPPQRSERQTVGFPWEALRSGSHVDSDSCRGRCVSQRSQCLDACGDVSNNPDPQAHREWGRCQRECRESGQSCIEACDNPSDASSGDSDGQPPPKKPKN